jgi:hypothetical protein
VLAGPVLLLLLLLLGCSVVRLLLWLHLLSRPPLVLLCHNVAYT